MSTRIPVSPLVANSLLLAGVFSLAACGGGAPLLEPQTIARAEAAAEPPPLFDERGRPRVSPPQLVPVDTAARTRPGLYATRAQFEWEELMAGPTTILLDVDALGTVASTVLLAQQVRGLRDSRGLAYFVRARRPTDAAQVVNTLADDGFAPVFMIVR